MPDEHNREDGDDHDHVDDGRSPSHLVQTAAVATDPNIAGATATAGAGLDALPHSGFPIGEGYGVRRRRRAARDGGRDRGTQLQPRTVFAVSARYGAEPNFSTSVNQSAPETA
jgi:hypothetical protein